MDDVDADIKRLETQFMRAWMSCDVGAIKALMTSESLMLFGTDPPVLLDRSSFVAALGGRFVCESYRFGAMITRRYGRAIWFTGQVELVMNINRREWGGHFLLTDLWVKSRIRRRWKLAERSLAVSDQDQRLSAAIGTLQLWR